MGVIAVAAKHLIAAGVTGDALVTALHEIEAATVPQRSKAAIRQARYRERKEYEHNETSQNVTSDDKEIPPTPPKENNNNKNINTRTREADQIRANLESTLSPETAQDLIDHRKKLKKPLTASAAKRLAGKLALCRDGPEAAANAMISNGWQGFEPEWMSRNDKRNSGNSGNGGSPGVVAFLRELHDQPGDDLHGGSEPVPNQRRQISG